jgi:DNA-binding Xre family transcriptional regulator
MRFHTAMSYPGSHSHVPAVTPEIQRGLDVIGELLLSLRQQRGMSQIRLEGRSGVDQTVISRLERGKQPSLRLVRLAAIVSALTGPGPGPEAGAPSLVPLAPRPPSPGGPSG